jgi:hypothetical protein
MGLKISSWLAAFAGKASGDAAPCCIRSLRLLLPSVLVMLGFLHGARLGGFGRGMQILSSTI